MVSDASLLQSWESGYGRPPYEQALVLLGAAAPHATVDQLLDMSLGDRDRNLLLLRKQLFGSRVESVAACPDCDERLEVAFDVDDILLPASDARFQDQTFDRWRIRFRPPNSRDLIAVANATPAQRANQLLEQCVLETRPATETGDGVDGDNLSELDDALKNLVADAVSDSDPQADVQFTLDCPDCQTPWTSPFDVVGFLWMELDVWCQRLLTEIHLLAKAYGWTESEVLSLSRWRRDLYVGMARQ